MKKGIFFRSGVLIFLLFYFFGSASSQSQVRLLRRPGVLTVKFKPIIIPLEKLEAAPPPYDIKKIIKPITLEELGLTKDQMVTFKKKDGTVASIKAEDYIKQLNEFENFLNKYGFSLRNQEGRLVKGAAGRVRFLRLKVPVENFDRQKKIFQATLLSSRIYSSPYQTWLKEYNEALKSAETQDIYDPFPFNWEWNWDDSWGNPDGKGLEDFGVRLGANLSIKGEENKKGLDLNSAIKCDLTVFGNKVSFIDAGIYRKDNDSYLKYSLLKNLRDLTEVAALETAAGIKMSDEIILRYDNNYTIFKKDDLLEIEFPFQFTIGPIPITGKVGMTGGGQLDARGGVTDQPKISAGSHFQSQLIGFGEAGVGLSWASAGLEVNLIILRNSFNLGGAVEIISPPAFQYSVYGDNNYEVLSGNIKIYCEVDYYIGSKEFEFELFSWDGLKYSYELFNIKAATQPALAKRHRYLRIDRIAGVTRYTARGEALSLNPEDQEFVIEADIGGQKYNIVKKDKNKDGILDRNDLAYNEFIYFPIPLFKQKNGKAIKVPIAITVFQKSKYPGLPHFNYSIDLAQGDLKRLELLFDPDLDKFADTTCGQQKILAAQKDEDIIVHGDTNYFGERNHGIEFNYGSTAARFKAAPAKKMGTQTFLLKFLAGLNYK